MRLKKPHRFRVVLLGALFLGLTGTVGARLYYLQLVQHEHYTDKADNQHYMGMEIQADRGDIVDRNGAPLAQSAGRFTVFMKPSYFFAPHGTADRDELIAAVAREAAMNPAEVRSKLDAKGVTALLKRVPQQDARRVARTLAEFDPRQRAFWVDRESQRIYPKSVASAVIGFCQKGVEGDTDGLAGLELAYDDALKGSRTVSRSQRSGISQALQPYNWDDLLAARGNTLTLTLDARIQEATEKALAEGVEKFSADCGGAIVMDPRSGAIIAMASYPNFDNNEFSTSDPDARRNRVLTDPLETGSVVKLFTAAILLDKNYVKPETIIDCEGGYAVVDGRRLHDSPGHYLNVATFREAMRFSSNIGIVKAAQVLENDEWYDMLRRFNFGARTGVDLPGEGAGILYPTAKWTKFSRTSLPMGYEISLTPIQIAAGISSLVNGGVYYQPYVVSEVRDPKGNLIRAHDPQPVRRVIRPTTSAIMRDLMEDVAELGTGKKARIGGYRVGGKTGTTRKSNVFTHPEYIASFGGALPINDPRVVLYVYIDNPKGEYYASIVAAPVFQAIASACVLHLGIPPSEELIVEAPVIIPDALIEERIAEQQKQRENEQLAFFGRMPDFAGMSMNEARGVLPHKLSRVTFMGSGVVSDQFPAPGETLNEQTEVVLHFAPQVSLKAAPTGGGHNGGRE